MPSRSQLAQAIAQGEGFGASPSNRPTRNNNPGDLTGTGYPGQTGVDAQGFAIFPTPAAGYSALQQYLSQHVSAVAGGASSGPYASLGPSSTLQDFLNVYAGSPDPGYVSTVASGVGASPSTPLSQLAAALGLTGVPGGSQTTTQTQSGAQSAPSGPETALPGSVDQVLQDIQFSGGLDAESNPAALILGVTALAAVVAYLVLR